MKKIVMQLFSSKTELKKGKHKKKNKHKHVRGFELEEIEEEIVEEIEEVLDAVYNPKDWSY